VFALSDGADFLRRFWCGNWAKPGRWRLRRQVTFPVLPGRD